MAYRQAKVQKQMTQPINLIFAFLKDNQRVIMWLFENTSLKIEGIIIGFDEYMNMVLDDAVEIQKDDTRRPIGRIMLKGDTISVIQRA